MTILKKVLKWTLVTVAIAYVLLVIVRAFQLEAEDKTKEQVAKIHATKLTLDDVMGKNLPPDPGEAADDTVVGIDANTNGIRDDVELAIFKEYPNSAKTRAVLLQYALALQMEVTQPFLNEEIVNSIVEENSRAGDCIADTLIPRKSPESSREYSDIEKIDSYINSVEDRHLNNQNRIENRERFYDYMGSFKNSEKPQCDIDVSTLPN